ncbi:hypothetical protein CULT_2140003 [[Clostridium] ultunense Esp]|nr:hypothetical protein CULT_2140003 [[Clostridium] ultunense Esp]
MIVKELLPQTVYRLRMLRPLAESELRVITQFYLPIIQQEAYSSIFSFIIRSLPIVGWEKNRRIFIYSR